MPEHASATAVVDPQTAPRWDYSVISIHARHNDVLEEHLKKHGQDGWELVFVAMPMANEYQCMFRRQER